MSQGMLGMLELSEVQETRLDLENKLAGPDGRVWLVALKRFLLKKNPWEKPLTWRTITLGQHQNRRAYRRAFNQSGFVTSHWADDLLKRTPCASKPTQVELVSLTAVELGFPKGATTRQVYKASKALGLDLCPAEVGPALRLAYPDQPVDEIRFIAMEPLRDIESNLKVFLVGRRRDRRFLSTSFFGPDIKSRGDKQWVFCRPQTTPTSK